MSHKFVGPVGKQFRGNKQRAMLLMGSARLLAQRGVDKIKARGGRGFQLEKQVLGDGSIVEAWVNQLAGLPPQIRVRIWCPQGEDYKDVLLESGLLYWNIALLEQQYPLLIAAKGALKAHFLGDPPYIQGKLAIEYDAQGIPITFEYNKAAPVLDDDTYVSEIYTSAVKHNTILGEQGRVQPIFLSTFYSGWMRLWIQALAGSKIALEDVLGDQGLTYDTGLLISPVNTFWLSRISGDGVRFTQLALSSLGGLILNSILAEYPDTPLTEAPWHSDQRLRLKLCYMLMQLSVPGTENRIVIDFAAETVAEAYADGFDAVTSHSWQWNRKSNKAVIAKGKWVDDGDAYRSRLCSVAVTWDEETALPTPELTITQEDTWRINPVYQMLWRPIGQQLELMLPTPSYLDGSFAAYEGATGVIHAFFDKSDALVILSCNQYSGHTVEDWEDGEEACLLPGASWTKRFESSARWGSCGFNGNVIQCVRKWANAATDSYSTRTMYEYSRPYGINWDGSWFLLDYYCIPQYANNPCYNNGDFLGALYERWDTDHGDICCTVSGENFKGVKDSSTESAGGTETKQALIISAYDPTVYFLLQITSTGQSGVSWTRSLQGSSSNYGSIEAYTRGGYVWSDEYQSWVCTPTGGVLFSADGCFGNNLSGWGGGYTSEASGTTPDTSSQFYNSKCYASETRVLADDFQQFFDYNLLDPTTWYKEINEMVGFASAGGVDTYTYTESEGKNSEDYPFAYSRYTVQAFWIGGA